MKSKIKKRIFLILISFVLVSLVAIMQLMKDSNKIVEVKEFIKNNQVVLYLSKDSNLKYSFEVLENYDIDYLNVDINSLNIFERIKLKKIVNNQYLNNTIVIYENGKILDTLNDFKEEEVIDFLQKNNIIPLEISTAAKQIVKDVQNIYNEEYAIIFMPYIKHKEILNQDKILKEISKKYNIEYKRIDAYLLSNKQKSKINAVLKISEVEEQILLLVRNKKIMANIRGIYDKKTYIEKLDGLSFIDKIEEKITQINYSDFELLLEAKDKSVIYFSKNNCKECETIYRLLSNMTYNYNIDVKLMDLTEETEFVAVKNRLTDIDYKDAFSLPMVIVFENNKVLDYIIGNSSEQYFMDVFIENGVIKGENLNE